MQSCTSCTQKFSFGEVYKSFWFGYKTLVCSNCKTKYEHSFKNRWIGGGSIGLGVFIGGIVQYYVESSFGIKMLAIGLVIILLGSLFSALCVPYMTFDKEEKKNYT